MAESESWGRVVPNASSAAAGAITGSYQIPFKGVHGFLRAPDGTFTSFDVPGSSGTVFIRPTGINPAGAITGWYIDAGFLGHGFLRTGNQEKED